MTDASIFHWLTFNIVIVILLMIDLWNAHRHPHRTELKEALILTAGWIVLALLFNGWIYWQWGPEVALTFLTGYLLEKSLSIDNLFVFLLIFSYFNVPETAKHKVLFYGILGAIVMRALLILGGVALVQAFHWMFYVFGIFLIVAGTRLAFGGKTEFKEEENVAYRLLTSFIPIIPRYEGHRFFVKEDGKWKGTLLFVVIVLIESTDLLFALDSIPAILGITTDAFIVYTSNIFAILGLRSLFFALEGVMQRFYLFHYALSLILILIGVKMLIAGVVTIPVWATFVMIVILISSALIGSLLFPKKDPSSH
jgi:tellurite resistance protein TerC